MSQTDIEMVQIEKLARELAQARRTLMGDVRSADEALGEVHAKWNAILKSDASLVQALQEKLEALVERSQPLFVKPQSQEFDGVRVGWRKGKGRLEIPDTEVLLKKIGTVLSKAQQKAVVKVKVTILKGALAKLPGELLKKLGINVDGAGPEAFVSFPKSDFQKHVDWWLKPLAVGEED